MAPSASPDGSLHPAHAEQLLDIAQRAIVDFVAERPLAVPSLAQLAPELREPGAAFVTLTVSGALQGCIGNVEGDEPLGQAVARLARWAASADPRFPPLVADQYDELAIEVSILSTMTPIAAGTREALLDELRPIDGLVLAVGRNRGLFLPDVWDQLPDPDAFVDHLLRKAGLPARPWPSRLRAWRFSTQTCARAVTDR